MKVSKVAPQGQFDPDLGINAFLDAQAKPSSSKDKDQPLPFTADDATHTQKLQALAERGATEGERDAARRKLEKLDPDEVESSPLEHVPGGKRYHTKLASESGLYKLIMRSDKPTARPFQNWVTRVVLPAIRPRNQHHRNTMTEPQTLCRRQSQHGRPLTCRNVRLTDAHWRKLVETGEAVRPKGKQGGRLSFSLALSLLLDHLAAEDLRATVESRRKGRATA